MSSRPCGELVADTGPLIALARLELLDSLPRLFERVWLTEAVFRESQYHPERKDAIAIAEAIDRKLLTRHGTETDVTVLRHPGLGPGELSSIRLAHARQCPILLDDKLARKLAIENGITVIGTIGLLLHARERKCISSIRPHLEALQDQGYFIAAELVTKALELAGE